jgi:hypothetical protein
MDTQGPREAVKFIFANNLKNACSRKYIRGYNNIRIVAVDLDHFTLLNCRVYAVLSCVLPVIIYFSNVIKQ